MLKIIRKYISSISLFISIFFFSFITANTFPLFHNLDADFNVTNVNSIVILEGEHHHEDNPKSACFDYHTIKIKEIGKCIVCQILNNIRFIFLTQSFNFYYKLYYLFNYFRSLTFLPSNIYNVSLSRAPPLS